MRKPIGKFFFCFGFDEVHRDDLEAFHVTLKYLGELDLDQLTQAIDAVNRMSPLTEAPQISFNRPALFGRDKNLPVLLPALTSTDPRADTFFRKWLDTRWALDLIKSDFDFPFNPHVTTSIKLFKGTPAKLHLCTRGYKVLHTWDVSSEPYDD